MQLYGLVNEFRLHALVTDELLRDCRNCGRCRFLLASCSHGSEHDTDSSSSSESDASSPSSSADRLSATGCHSEDEHQSGETTRADAVAREATPIVID